MSEIREEDDREWVSENDAALLVQRGILEYCGTCEVYHHAEYTRWAEVREALADLAAARRLLFATPTSPPPAE